MTTYDQILNATNKYAKKLHEHDVGLIIAKMVEDYGLQDQVYALPYPGTLPFEGFPGDVARDLFEFETGLGQFQDLWDLNTTRRYNIGMFSIPMEGDQEHYLAIWFDNLKKKIILWDSLASNLSQTANEARVFKLIYPDYEVEGLYICSGCRAYQTGGRWYEQNVFCHTWSLWFIDNVLYALSKGLLPYRIVDVFETSCESEYRNLTTIKVFARHLAENYLDYKVLKGFNYIFYYGIDTSVDDGIVPLLDKDIHEMWQDYDRGDDKEESNEQEPVFLNLPEQPPHNPEMLKIIDSTDLPDDVKAQEKERYILTGKLGWIVENALGSRHLDEDTSDPYDLSEFTHSPSWGME